MPSRRSTARASTPHALAVAAPLPQMFTIAEVAMTLRVHTRTIHRWIVAGDLAAHRFGRTIRVSEPDLQSFLQRRR